MPKVDMSADAVTTRLKRVSQLRRLCLSLAAAEIVGDEAAKIQVKKPPAPFQNLPNAIPSEKTNAIHEPIPGNTKSR